MKHWTWYLVAVVIVAVIGWMPFQGTDVAKLQPVELILITAEKDRVFVETDTGDAGVGADLLHAFSDLKESTPGQVFLETAEYLVIGGEEQSYLNELAEILRPSCKVCIMDQTMPLPDVTAYLRTHEPQLSLQDWRAGSRGIPKLIIKEGRLHLVS